LRGADLAIVRVGNEGVGMTVPPFITEWGVPKRVTG
jgi:hypothetical protein